MALLRQRRLVATTLIISASSIILWYGLVFDVSCFLVLLKSEDDAVITKADKNGLTLSSISIKSKNASDDPFVIDDINVVNKGGKLIDDYMQPLNVSLIKYYYCGYDFASEVGLDIFPEFRGHEIEFSKDLLQNVTSRDIVAIDVDEPCAGVDGGFKRKLPWFEKNFQGTTIIVNAEFYGFGSWPRGFHLGYGPADNITSMTLFSCARILLATKTWDLQQNVFDPAKKKVSTKERFLIYSHTHCVKFRDVAFHRLSQIDHAYHMGKCRGIRKKTISEEAINGTERVGFHDNYKIFGSYRFCIVMENSNLEGYITEKILAAFLGGCIPIYYGTTEIFLLFNKKAFIYYDIENPQPALYRVTFLNQNNTAFDEVMLEPILANGNETIEEFFSLRDDIGGGKLQKRIRQMIYNGRQKYIE